ncbi:MAG: threonine synthase, partial [Planctomycetes bacterium UTPLA1]
EEITEAMKSAGRLAGVFAEPAAAAGIAGVRRAVMDGVIAKTADVLAVVTGNGLKDIKTAMSIAGSPTEVDPLPDRAASA